MTGLGALDISFVSFRVVLNTIDIVLCRAERFSGSNTTFSSSSSHSPDFSQGLCCFLDRERVSNSGAALSLA